MKRPLVRSMHASPIGFQAHEVYSGLLTFIVYYLLKHPEAMRRLREEVDTMIGERPMTIDDVHKLPYLIGEFRHCLWMYEDSLQTIHSCNARDFTNVSYRFRSWLRSNRCNHCEEWGLCIGEGRQHDRQRHDGTKRP